MDETELCSLATELAARVVSPEEQIESLTSCFAGDPQKRQAIVDATIFVYRNNLQSTCHRRHPPKVVTMSTPNGQ